MAFDLYVTRSTDALDRSLAGLHVVDLFALMQRPAERDRAFAEVVIGHGSACSPHPRERARWGAVDGEAPACMPRFVDEAAMDDVLAQANLLREHDATRGLGGVQPHAIDIAARSIGREEQARFGRLYACTAAWTGEG